ncbi:gallinacin-8-like [Oenanthe melanoleuca]|uniref:gallinacin-8-like n=1 Tax=Oenanthe melanoleuca TaxID=2939378 RepID=UPI0024C16A18|nr:gallinacin-8-like [Oenanthe melanoleuca]
MLLHSGLSSFLSLAQRTLEEEDGREKVKDPHCCRCLGTSMHLLYLVALNLDMKIFSLFFAVLLLMLQGTSGFLRAPNTEVQCRQAGGVCSSHHCPPPHTRPFGRCQQGIPCCRTVYD